MFARKGQLKHGEKNAAVQQRVPDWTDRAFTERNDRTRVQLRTRRLMCPCMLRASLLPKGDKEHLAQMAEDTEGACDLLSTAKVNVIAYACTTGSLIKGIEWEKVSQKEWSRA